MSQSDQLTKPNSLNRPDQSPNQSPDKMMDKMMDKMICVGKNYLEHAKELGDAVPETPIFFLKPPSVAKTVIQMGGKVTVTLPRGRGQVHHECEIIAQLSHDGSIKAVSLGLDLTLRELQAELKKKGHPWEIAKVFRDSAVIGPWIPISEFRNYLDEEFQFFLNGQIKQEGRGKQMRLLPEDCIQYAKKVFPIVENDVLFTGTPAGVGPLVAGDECEMKWGGRTLLRVAFIE